MDDYLMDLGEVTTQTMGFVRGNSLELSAPFKCANSSPVTQTQPQ